MDNNVVSYKFEVTHDPDGTLISAQDFTGAVGTPEKLSVGQMAELIRPLVGIHLALIYDLATERCFFDVQNYDPDSTEPQSFDCVVKFSDPSVT